MLPLYVLTVNVYCNDVSALEQKQVHEQMHPCLSRLDGLKGSFDRKQSTIDYYWPPVQHDKSAFLLARGIVMISVGKSRGQFLIQLYQSIVDLIALELPHLEVRAQINELKFS